ncbi:MAG: NAD(P)-binding domain-containing protein [Burkholderiales bacterium]|nr:NAD(P)-binding domain-containing protein [Burkholderiales bacterium]
MIRRQRLAVVGFGRLGRACAGAIAERHDAELAGVVRRPESAGRLAPPHERVAVVTHVRDLGPLDVALVCVPAAAVDAVARELLQQRLAIVECAAVAPEARDEYYAALADYARRRRGRAMLGAGWDPGVFTLVGRCFETLIPRGESVHTRRPAASLHHTAAAEAVRGVKGALACEYPDASGRIQRYVYVELAEGARLDAVTAAIAADPAFVGEATQVFAVPSVAALEEEAQGVLLERRGTARSGAHQTLLLEGRFDRSTLAARVMLDAARRLPALNVGGHRYSLTL